MEKWRMTENRKEFIIDSLIRQGPGPCLTCEFNFPDFRDEAFKGVHDWRSHHKAEKIAGCVCANVHYNEKITDFKTIRDCWSISFDEFVKRSKSKKFQKLEAMSAKEFKRYFIKKGWILNES